MVHRLMFYCSKQSGGTCDVQKIRENFRSRESVGNGYYATLTYEGPSYSQAYNAIDKTFGKAIWQQMVICHGVVPMIGVLTSATIKLHGKLRRNPKFNLRFSVPKVFMVLLLAALRS